MYIFFYLNEYNIYFMFIEMILAEALLLVLFFFIVSLEILLF